MGRHGQTWADMGSHKRNLVREREIREHPQIINFSPPQPPRSHDDGDELTAFFTHASTRGVYTDRSAVGQQQRRRYARRRFRKAITPSGQA
jgi:hypothetical protein